MGWTNDHQLFDVKTTVKPNKQHGWAGLGTTSWGHADFDNLHLDSGSQLKGNNYLKKAGYYRGPGTA